eukprot:15503340-Heterocapsa_arctica.AAC.1
MRYRSPVQLRPPHDQPHGHRAHRRIHRLAQLAAEYPANALLRMGGLCRSCPQKWGSCRDL